MRNVKGIYKVLVGGILGLMLLSASDEAYAQDPQFSQFNAAPLYLNPGFTGTTIQHRFIANYRMQWPALPQSFSTYAFSYDYYHSPLNSGFGFMATTDRAGSADLRSSSFNLSYAFKVKFSEGWIFSPGVMFGYGVKSLDFNKLLFGDQIDFGTNQVPTTNDPIFRNLKNKNYFDFSAGFVVYNKRYWGGVSVYHLNQPNASLVQDQAIVPMRLSMHGGARFVIKEDSRTGRKTSSIAPSFIYKRQGNFDQLDIGLHFNYNPIMAGVWYRGIPVQQNVLDNLSQDAVTVLFGLRFSQVDIGYSYDITVSELGPANSGGAHEISLVYQYWTDRRNKKKPQKFVPCPTF